MQCNDIEAQWFELFFIISFNETTYRQSINIQIRFKVLDVNVISLE